MSIDNPKHFNAAPTPRTAAASPIDLAALAEMIGPSLAQRFEAGALRNTSAELGYGCVDWFIYGAEARVAPAPLRG
jgi:hypothetical protein